MKKLIFVTMFSLLVAMSAYSQNVKHRQMVDMPTAGNLERGSYAMTLRMFGNGGLLVGVNVGISPRFSFGLSYGGENVIGEGKVNWNVNPGIQTKFRLIDEQINVPAVSFGFNSQGYGAYDGVNKRYQFKSRGAYAVASKNFDMLQGLGFHGGINYSFETDDGDKDVNLFFGADLTFNREFRIFIEHDLAMNDDELKDIYGSGSGYMNTGFQWTFSDQLFLQFDVKNLLKNGQRDIVREFRIEYVEYF